jgi:hypothetical protein
MGLVEISAGQAIDRNLINSIIRAVNLQEDASRLGAYVKRGATYIDTDDNMQVLGFQEKFRVAAGQVWVPGGVAKNVAFPRAFSAPPVVVASAEGASSYINVHIAGVTETYIGTVGLFRHGSPYNNQPLPDNQAIPVNFMAIGPRP